MKRKIPMDTPYFHYYNVNPKDKCTNDCVIRALAVAMDKTWDEVFNDLVELAKKYKLMPNDDKIYTRYLKANGWVKHKQLRKDDNTKYDGSEFCDYFNDEMYDSIKTPIFARIGTHHVTCFKRIDDTFKIWDIWNCSRKYVGVYWTKEDN